MENNKQLLTEISISKELESSFIDYAMSVIVSRAIPDIRDGLKPVHRRILYAMNELGMLHNTAFKKSARVVGEVIAKYHPHGDSAVYESLVRMAQPFSLRYTLVKGQGNFGSVDGDSAAAMRYTESKLEKISNQLLEDLNKETVSFVENYDGSEREPTVLPAKIPNLLLNGSTGIAVGMATSIPPHNLTELVNAIIAYAKNHNISIEELLQIIPGPDFPTGGSIVNKAEMTEGYFTGRGRVVIRSKTEIEYDEKENRGRIIITEIPYMVTKSALILRIAELVKEKHIESISDIRDESNRQGIRVVIFLKRGYIPEVELNKLFKLSQLQTSFAINMLTLVNNKPEVIDIKKYIQEFLHFQIEILINKTKFQLNKSEARKHILEGLSIALGHINEVIEIIKQAKDTKVAQEQLMTKYHLSEEQAKSILDMKLSRLTSLERTNMQDEINQLVEAINGFNKIINSREVQIDNIIEMLEHIKNEFGDERRTEISFNDLSSIEDEDLIPNKDIVITLSSNGYIKRIPVEEYRTQGRGGMGSRGATTYDDDFIKNIIVANTHTDILFFTSEGRVFKIRGHAIPEMGKNSKGIPVLNLIDIAKSEKIMAVLPIKEYENMDLMFLTKNGIMKKTIATEYQRVNRNGKIAINLREQDQLLNVIQISSQTDIDILIGNSNGKAVRFKSSDVRAIGRSGTGVIGMDIDEGKAIDFGTSEQGDKVLAVSSKGFGKLTSIEEYRLTRRGSKGVFTISTQKSGDLVGLKLVKGDEDLMVVTDKGTTIRLSLSEVSELSRNTKGVKIINIKDNEKITSLAVVPSEKAIEEEVKRTIEHRITLETELKEVK